MQFDVIVRDLSRLQVGAGPFHHASTIALPWRGP